MMCTILVLEVSRAQAFFKVVYLNPLDHHYDFMYEIKKY